MFLRYYVELDQSRGELADKLRHDPGAWLGNAVMDSLEAGGQLSAALGLTVANTRLERKVDVNVGEAYDLSGVTVFPLELCDRSRGSLFPRFDADLEVASLGKDRSQLAINVRYEPPLGFVGAIADRALMHRVAEATVKDFMDQLARRLTTVRT